MLEARVEDLEKEAGTSEDVEVLIDEIERQQEEIEELREGYQEIGEITKLVLKELRETRGQ
ncbi:MAG: hypothetical protein ABEJ66_02005 [Candidatus Nanohaloarchaea archaeon]